MYASSSCIHNWWLSPYGTSKKVNEETAFEHQVALRFTTVYGDGARENMFIPKLLNNKVDYVTKHTRDFIHVDDVVEAIILLMNKNIRSLKPAYDIGTGIGNQVHTLADIAGYTDLPWLMEKNVRHKIIQPITLIYYNLVGNQQSKLTNISLEKWCHTDEVR